MFRVVALRSGKLWRFFDDSDPEAKLLKDKRSRWGTLAQAKSAFQAYANEIVAKEVWSESFPQKPGNYLFRCGENGHMPESIRVYFGRSGELWVECPDLGKMPIKHYHEGLSAPTWKPKPQERGCPFDEELPRLSHQT